MTRIVLVAALLLGALATATAQITPPQYLILFGQTSSASGSSGSGCANQLVLVYSNSCALIGQAFGQ